MVSAPPRAEWCASSTSRSSTRSGTARCPWWSSPTPRWTQFERVLGEEFDLLSDEDLETVAQGLAPESSALVVVWENAWATRLASALRGSGGEVLFMERIPRDSVERAVAALDEN
ncbi:hypothetical protein [Streptomyces sp. NBC_01264]|uniref:hypothetical protein n=1 Tax=Streptomyces sp. NBC_01264 TaxID=2903804 RepID=UPI00225B45D2|nr:hypothetical protein [Streptomyces sp. NBC_01264]MCX4777561.1 DUF1269 domain-containing protein [Streptomyces sp. NBC_01264]